MSCQENVYVSTRFLLTPRFLVPWRELYKHVNIVGNFISAEKLCHTPGRSRVTRRVFYDNIMRVEVCQSQTLTCLAMSSSVTDEAVPDHGYAGLTLRRMYGEWAYECNSP